MTIARNIELLTKELPTGVTLIAVSKTHSAKEILEAYDAGQRHFGENKVQEVAGKRTELPSDITWHFIGHLQTNKVKYLAPFVGMIHSIDSLKLLNEVNREANKNNRVIDCLLQFHIATEETKFGLSLEEGIQLLSAPSVRELPGIKLRGVMGMATYTDDTDLVRREFRLLRGYFEELKSRFFMEDEGFSEISMGMSGDYLLAAQEGSTMVRVGTAIFGERNYK
jgi:pyridoxal phosphate enzyme (YggS family)